MRQSLRSFSALCALSACTAADPAPTGEAKSGEVAAPVTPAKVTDATATDAKATDAKATDAKATVVPTKPPAEVDAPVDDTIDEPGVAPAIPGPAPAEIAIKPWATSDHVTTWTLAAEPAEAVVLAGDLHAGVLGRAGSGWWQASPDGGLGAVAMSVEPKAPIVGVWPSDAWFVDRRSRMEETDEGGEFEYVEIRLMKLRDGKRWVPQVYSGDQWFHPGTDDEDWPHMSTRSGMLVYPASLTRRITRVAGRHDEPVIGPHRGEAVDFVETGAGKVYVISMDAAGYYAQTECEDDECVAASTKKLPLSGWTFGKRVPRGKHSVSVIATSGDRDLILHHRGKSDGWLLEELPPGEKPTGIWASEEGGLWTLTGERLRWRDTESVWRDVALPDGMTTPSVALSEDRKQVWVSGVVGGSPKVFTTQANAPVP